MERLGHSSISVTMDRYGHLFPAAGKGAARLLDQLFGIASAYCVGHGRGAVRGAVSGILSGMRPRLLAALAFLAAGAVVLAHGNNPSEHMGHWFGHSDAAYWADRENGIMSPEAIAVGHVVAAVLTGLPRAGLWLLAGAYAAIGAWIWITGIVGNVADVAIGQLAVVDLVVPGGMVVAYIAIVAVLYRALRSPGSDIRVGSASPAEDRRQG